LIDRTFAWLFPGQGVQAAGMARDLLDRSAAARAVFDSADRVLGVSISQLCATGPEDEIQQTRNSQPAIMATSIACLEAAREAGSIDEPPAFVAGHSLGEYTAAVAAGAVSLDDGFRLVAERGRLMQDAADLQPGAMAALLGIEENAAAAVCAEAGATMCNLNAPGQVVVGGSKESVEAAMRLALERGASRGVLIKVSGAFHTSFMQPAADGMRAAIAAVDVADPRTPIIANTSGRPLTTADDVCKDLVEQIVSPVLWQRSVEYLVSQGVSSVIEFGPERVLTGLVRRIDKSIAVHNVQDVASAQALRETLAAVS
jgi:[acyl-carrier-protein] S-malonyltransferase